LHRHVAGSQVQLQVHWSSVVGSEVLQCSVHWCRCCRWGCCPWWHCGPAASVLLPVRDKRWWFVTLLQRWNDGLVAVSEEWWWRRRGDLKVLLSRRFTVTSLSPVLACTRDKRKSRPPSFLFFFTPHRDHPVPITSSTRAFIASTHPQHQQQPTNQPQPNQPCPTP